MSDSDTRTGTQNRPPSGTQPGDGSVAPATQAGSPLAGGDAPWLTGPPPPPPLVGASGIGAGPAPGDDRPRASGAPFGQAADDTLAEGRAGTGERGARRMPFSAAGDAARSASKELASHSPWLLASVAILAAFVIGWCAGALAAFRHAPGLTGRGRIVEFFTPGSLLWAFAVLFAVALFAVGQRLEPFSRGSLPVQEWLPGLLFFASSAVGLSAFVNLLVELTSFGTGIDAALSGFIGYLAVMVVAAASGWWSYRLYEIQGRDVLAAPRSRR